MKTTYEILKNDLTEKLNICYEEKKAGVSGDALEKYLMAQKKLDEYLKDNENLKSAFIYEMFNVEYAINWQADLDTLAQFYKFNFYDAPNDMYELFEYLNMTERQRVAYLDARKYVIHKMSLPDYDERLQELRSFLEDNWEITQNLDYELDFIDFNDKWQEMFLLEDEVEQMNAADAFRLGYYSSRFNPANDYFRYDGYGNLESTDFPYYCIDIYQCEKIYEAAIDGLLDFEYPKEFWKKVKLIAEVREDNHENI